MSFKFFLLVFSALVQKILNAEVSELEIMGIEPNAGPVYGETRVTVRLRDFDTSLIDSYDRPKVSQFKFNL